MPAILSQVIPLHNAMVEAERAGVVRDTYNTLMVTDPNDIPMM